MGKMSNRHDLNGLGYTRAASASTMGGKGVSLSEPLKLVLVRIVFCNTET